VSQAGPTRQPTPNEAGGAEWPEPDPVRSTEPADVAGHPDAAGEDELGLRPLTARSVVLSVLLGTHPPLLPVHSLVRTAEVFNISEGTARVALSRLTAEGDVMAEGGGYRLSDRLVARQRRQDDARRPVTRPWRGTWELAVASPDIRSAVERGALGAELAGLRLAEIRSGIWARPANLRRDWPASLEGRAWRFEAKSPAGDVDNRTVAASLWDLDAWAVRARALLDALAGAARPARRFVVTAAIVRHLQADPLLPPSLLPGRWPGRRLRDAYAAYERELGDLLRHERTRHG
jgi:phenylacetic acid degradation operon negative regulatory protein